MDGDHLLERAVDTALLEAVGSRLSAKQLHERRTAALARWRGHTRTMPKMLRKTADPKRMSERVGQALDELYDEHRPLTGEQKARAVTRLASAGPVLRHVPEPDLRDLGTAAGDAGENTAARQIAGHLGMERFLSEGQVYDLHPLGGRRSQNSVLHGKVDGLDVIVKPLKGLSDRGNADHTPYWSVRSGTDAANERGGFLVGERLGLPVSHTVVRKVRGEGKAIVQEKIGGDDSIGGGEWFKGRHGPRPSTDQLARAMRPTAILDAVIGNLDRHLDQFRVGSDGTLYPVDHGIAFPDRPARRGRGLIAGDYDHADPFDPDVEFANTNAMDFNEGERLTARERAALRGMRSSEFAAQLKTAGVSAKAIARTQQRIDALLQHGHLPLDAKRFIYDPEDELAWQ
jgi:hypothetical protein